MDKKAFDEVVLDELPDFGMSLPDLVVDDDPISIVDDIVGPVDTSWEEDGDHSKFIDYLKKRLTTLPKHSGKTTVGCERVLAVLRRLNKEISQALQSDIENLIDEDEAERLRDQIFDYTHRIEQALDTLMGKKQRKKSDLRIGKNVLVRLADGGAVEYYLPVSDSTGEMLLPVNVVEPTDAEVQSFAAYEQGLHKNASARIFLMADPFLHEITKIIIEGHVTAGKNIDEVYTRLDDKYKFTDRDHLAIQSLLKEKGLYMNKDLSRTGETDIFSWDGKGNAPKNYPV